MRVFKKRESLTGGGLYRQWEEWDIGDIIVGKLVGFHTDKFDKVGVKLEVEYASLKDKSESKYLNKVLSINNCGSLGKAFIELKNDDRIGELFQFEYQGTTEVLKGKFAGKDCHVVELSTVEDDSEDL